MSGTRVFHVVGCENPENPAHVGKACARAANRPIFSFPFSERARSVDICTYLVCMLTPSSRGVIISQSMHKIMKNHEKSSFSDCLEQVPGHILSHKTGKSRTNV